MSYSTLHCILWGYVFYHTEITLSLPNKNQHLTLSQYRHVE